MSIYHEPIYTKQFEVARFAFWVNVGIRKAERIEVYFWDDKIIAGCKDVVIEKPLSSKPPKPDYDWAADICQEVAEKIVNMIEAGEWK